MSDLITNGNQIIREKDFETLKELKRLGLLPPEFKEAVKRIEKLPTSTNDEWCHRDALELEKRYEF